MINNFDSTGSSGSPEEKKPSDDTTGLFVSLYLIVLAFFVVMNSISNQDQNKANAATESVTRAFKNSFAPEADFVDVSANTDSKTPNDEFYEQITGVFASLVGFEGKFPTQGGNVVKVKFRSRDLFEKGATSLRANQNEFIKQLSDFLKGGRDSEKREISIVISTGESLPQGPKYWENIAILRAGSFIKQLTRRGVEDNKLSMGVKTGEDGWITVTFFTRDRVNTVENLKGYDTKNAGPQP